MGSIDADDLHLLLQDSVVGITMKGPEIIEVEIEEIKANE